MTAIETCQGCAERALVDELRPEACATLDAWLERREDEDARRLLARLADMRRAALFEYNRRNRTKHILSCTIGWSDDERHLTCRFCGDQVATAPSLVALAAAAKPHLTQCALEYLAGLRAATPESAP